MNKSQVNNESKPLRDDAVLSAAFLTEVAKRHDTKRNYLKIEMYNDRLSVVKYDPEQSTPTIIEYFEGCI